MVENSTITPSHTGAGEVVELPYLRVVFQKGFPRDVGINGVRVQEVIQVAVDRLHHYQQGPLACEENAQAIRALEEAICALDDRVARRQEQGVYNTLKPHEYVRTEDECEDFSATGA